MNILSTTNIKRPCSIDSPVIVYSRDAANRLLKQGFAIISIEKNLKRKGDTSIFLFEPENGRTFEALLHILGEMKKEDENQKAEAHTEP